MSLGLGVMIQMLGGNQETVDAYNGAVGKTIANCTVSDSMCEITFSDGTGLRITDEGQSCCENRYISCDDRPTDHIGGIFSGIEEKPWDGPDEAESEYGECHDKMFVEVHTSKGSFTMCTHNEHNGYYGGFSIQVTAF